MVTGSRIRLRPRVALTAAVVAALLASLAPVRPALADSHTVGFDDIGGDGTTVQSQYSAQGLTFVTSSPVGGSPTLPVVVTDSNAPSNPHAATIRDQSCSPEFCANYSVAKFRDRQSHVRVFAGVYFSSSTSTVTVQAYNEVGTPVSDPAGQASAPGVGTTYVQLDVSSSLNDIVFVSLMGGNAAHIAIDNLTYDVPATPGPTAPPGPGTPPGPGGTGPKPGTKPTPPAGPPPVCSFSRKDNTVVALAQDGTVDVPLVARRSSNWTGALTFSVGGLPAGLSGAFDPPSVTGPGETPVKLKLTAAAAPGGDVAAKVSAVPAAAGVSGCSADVAFTVRPGYSVAVQGFEVTQAIQVNDLPQRSATETSVPYKGVLLAANKKTVVRVFANARYGPGGGVPNVAATLSAFAAGSSTALAGGPINPVWGTRTLAPGPAGISNDERRDPNGAFAFELPPAWTTGSIDLEATLNAPTGFFAGVDACNTDVCNGVLHLRLTGVEFTTTKAVNVLPIAMPINGKTLASPSYACYQTVLHEGGALIEKDEFTCPTIGVFASARLVAPLGDGQLVIPDYYGDVDISDIAASSASKDLQGILATFRLWKYANAHDSVFFNEEEFDPSTSNMVIGVVPGASGIRTRAKGADCRDNHATFECDQWRVATVPDGGRPLTGVAHELFHLFGRYHASSCSIGGADVGNIDDWPTDQQGYLGGYGLDTRNRADTLGPFRVLGVDAGPNRSTRIPTPNPWFDFMGYCANPDESDSWVSPRNWNNSLAEYATSGPTTPTALAPAGPMSLRLAAAAPVLAVDALAGPDGRVLFGSVTPSHRFHQAPVPGSAYHLIARDASGGQLADIGMAVSKMHGEQGIVSLDLVAGVPVTGVASLEIAHDGKVVARRARAPRAPSVRFISPASGDHVSGDHTTVRWQTDAMDAVDAGTITGVSNRLAALDFSGDDGRTWKAVYAGPDKGSVSLPTYLLAGSTSARLRVTVNDGFSDTVATSSTFWTPGSVPTVHILDPAPEAGLTSAASLYLSGQAFDDRGRQLKD
ncbi:MAG TPA: hypothetical protein VIN56_01705, partial [Candidatus Dormibacteraeota bacterium]